MTEDYTWSEFCDEVRALMPLNSDRIGVQDGDDGTPGFLTKMIRQCVIELQDAIPSYRKGHEALYHEYDFAREGAASVGVFPPQGQVKELWMFDPTTKCRYPVIEWDWEKRFELVNELLNIADNQGRFTYDEGGRFLAYPAIVSPWLLSVIWDGLKVDFEDDERVPFTEATALCVADFVNARIEREVNRDLKAYESYMGDYRLKRRGLFRTEKERVK